tara:strand:+ start:1104 stop:3908 length:2805 start_codon:yes stop_codon:yes gene_type:complete
MSRIWVYYFCLFTSSLFIGQNSIKGIVVDERTNETLIGANILINDKIDTNNKFGTATDINGYFEFKELSGKFYDLSVSYIGYGPKIISISFEKNHLIDTTFKLSPDVILDAVVVSSDQAQFRKTPVSLSNVKLEKIERELGGQEIPMLLNSTPGVYATQQGGGDGDVRINIRGFNQRNVAVMIDGVPMNDMENGWVYWSNWFGLDALTRTIQVQRGLGASKLALPSVGGTINILTKGIDSQEGGSIKTEWGSGNYVRTTLAYTTPNLNIGKFNFATSFKQSNGIIEQTGSHGMFYYAKWQKQFNNHLFALSIFGAPQEHDQRKYQTGIAVYDKQFASDLGVDTASLEGGYGLNYNPNWGTYNDYKVVFENGTAIDTIFGVNRKINKHKNFYHKPNLNFQHLWKINEKNTLTNIIYHSKGQGGGTNYYGQAINYTNNNQIDFQEIYDLNSGNRVHPWFGDLSINTTYSDSLHKSSGILYASRNNHYWTGLLSTFTHVTNKNVDISTGLDIRTYKGEHYAEVYDLLGGDYYLGTTGIGSKNAIGENSIKLMLEEGDKIYYHNDGLVRWAGVFQQMEYNYGNISAFINITGSKSSYRRIDYFRKKDIVISDTILVEAVGINDTVNYNGFEYTSSSPEARYTRTNWENFLGYTAKCGANWNIDEYNNIFVNTGLLSKAPRFSNVFDYDNQTYQNTKNEIVKAVEFGYGHKSTKFALNLNAYYTIWENKPQTGTTQGAGGETLIYNINGINALHKGVELDFAVKLTKGLKYEFLCSVGDWQWTSGDTVNFYLNQELYSSDYFDAKGVYVGDSPQKQIGSSISYNFKSKANTYSYITLKGMYFSKFFSDYDPFYLDENKKVWKIPPYHLFSLHLGRSIYREKLEYKFKLNVLNLFNTVYISDAENNSTYVEDSPLNSDAASASIFFGLGRKITASIQINF